MRSASAAAGAIAIIALIAFWRLFDPAMHGQETALVAVGVGATCAGVGVTILALSGLRRSVSLIAVALLLVAAAALAVGVADLRVDRGNKKALVALAVATASAGSAITFAAAGGSLRRRLIP